MMSSERNQYLILILSDIIWYPTLAQMAVESPVDAGKKTSRDNIDTNINTLLQWWLMLARTSTVFNTNQLHLQKQPWDADASICNTAKELHDCNKSLYHFHWTGGAGPLVEPSSHSEAADVWRSKVLALENNLWWLGIGTLSSRRFEFCSTLIHSCLSFLHWTFSDQTNNHDVVNVFWHVMTGSFWSFALLILSNKLCRWHSPNETLRANGKAPRWRCSIPTVPTMLKSIRVCLEATNSEDWDLVFYSGAIFTWKLWFQRKKTTHVQSST